MGKRAIVAGIGLVVLCAAGPASEDARPILEKCDVAEGYGSQYAEFRQIITTTSGQKRTLTIRGWAVENGDKQLSEYLDPADIKGQKILMTDDGDNIWMFNPETRRTRKLGSHMKKKKVMGSDFTYEDQAGGKLIEKFVGVVLREEEQGGVACQVLELEPTPKGPSYRKVLAFVGKADYITRRVDYFQNDETEPFKQLIMEDVRPVGDKIVAHKMTMTNLLDRTETVNFVDRIQFNVEIPDSVFESRNLER